MMGAYTVPQNRSELYHYGVLGMRWGIRRYQPYDQVPRKSGKGGKEVGEAKKTYSDSDFIKIDKVKFKRGLKVALGASLVAASAYLTYKGIKTTQIPSKTIHQMMNDAPNSEFAKKHMDQWLSKDTTTLQTLSWDPNRMADTDYFFTAYRPGDKILYGTRFNKAMKQQIFDANGNPVGEMPMLKYKITSKLNKDIKIASEDSSIRAFTKLYREDPNFADFVKDKNKMESLFLKEKYVFKPYKEVKRVLDKFDKNPKYVPTDNECGILYRMFNFTIPNSTGGAPEQRAKFFNLLKEQGYSGILDTNDGLYNTYKGSYPSIIFDMEAIIPGEAKRTTMRELKGNRLAFKLRNLTKH